MFTSDSKHVVALIDDTLKFWNIIDGKETMSINNVDNPDALIFSSDGKILAILVDGTLNLWDMNNNKLIYKLEKRRLYNDSIDFL